MDGNGLWLLLISTTIDEKVINLNRISTGLQLFVSIRAFSCTFFRLFGNKIVLLRRNNLVWCFRTLYANAFHVSAHAEPFCGYYICK